MVQDFSVVWAVADPVGDFFSGPGYLIVKQSGPQTGFTLEMLATENKEPGAVFQLLELKPVKTLKSGRKILCSLKYIYLKTVMYLCSTRSIRNPPSVNPPRNGCLRSLRQSSFLLGEKKKKKNLLLQTIDVLYLPSVQAPVRPSPHNL